MTNKTLSKYGIKNLGYYIPADNLSNENHPNYQLVTNSNGGTNLIDDDDNFVTVRQSYFKDDGDFVYDVRNRHGNIVLDRVIQHFDCSLSDKYTQHDAVTRIIDLYKQWVTEDVFMMLEKTTMGIDLAEIRHFVMDSIDYCVKASKRGNDVYRNRTLGRIESIIFHGDEYFSTKDTSRNFKTNALWLTLTHSTRDNGMIKDAWNSLGEHWNKFITALRNKYGRISYFRTFESFKEKPNLPTFDEHGNVIKADYFPHIHAVLIFHEHEFKTFQYKDKTLVPNKNEIAKLWHSNIKLEGVRCLSDAIGYLSKYITKAYNTTDKGGDVTSMALMWYFRKRSYAISRDFLDAFDLIRTKHNSNLTIGIDGLQFIYYEYIGLLPGELVRKFDRYENYIECTQEMSAFFKGYLESFELLRA